MFRFPLPDGLAAFAAMGNKVEGQADPDSVGTIEWEGRGHSLRLGPGVKLSKVRLVFRGSRGRISIGEKAVVRGSVRSEHGGKAIICRRTIFNRPAMIRACEGGTVRIGVGCLLSNVSINNSDMHSIIDVESGKRLNPARDISIGDRVWLGEDVAVYKGATIGEGSIIGARSTVLKDIPANVTAAGTPAEVLRQGVTWRMDLIRS